MYSKQQASQVKRNFWTSFGQYMRPLPGMCEEPVNWLNYKTGVRHLFFRLDVDNRRASIAIEMRHPDIDQQRELFEKFEQLKAVFFQTAGGNWVWELHATDEDHKPVSRIIAVKKGVNIFNIDDWPAIISFLKKGILDLDKFWNLVKDGFY